jgi:hypothetical protein
VPLLRDRKRVSLVANLHWKDLKKFSAIPIIQENTLSFILSALKTISGTGKPCLKKRRQRSAYQEENYGSN